MRHPQATVHRMFELVEPIARRFLVVEIDEQRVRVELAALDPLLQRLARVYLGPGVKFPPMDDPPPGFVMRIAIERVGGVGPWTGCER